MTEHLLLKWGTLKGWKVESARAYAALNDYADAGPQSPNGAMTQHDTEQQKVALCHLIDAIDGEIENGWTGETMSPEAAKAYVMEYRK